MTAEAFAIGASTFCAIGVDDRARAMAYSAAPRTRDGLDTARGITKKH